MPLLLTGPLISYTFGLNGMIKEAMQQQDPARRPLSLFQIALASWIATPAVVVFSCPIEVTRARLQYQNPHITQLYRGPLDLLVKIYRVEGVRGWYRGVLGSVTTRLIGSPIYFATYEGIMRMLYPRADAPTSPIVSALVGGFAGGFHWLFFFPG